MTPEQSAVIAASAPTMPDDLVERLRALDDETICFDGPATYALLEEAAAAILTLRGRVEEAEGREMERNQVLQAFADKFPAPDPSASHEAMSKWLDDFNQFLGIAFLKDPTHE